MINNNYLDSGNNYRRPLNFFRGIAALYVAIYHLRYFSTYDWFGEFQWIRLGYVGVDFFFLLSGLIISHVYLSKAQHYDKKQWLKFYWFRVARLFPVHFTMMVTLLAASLIHPLIEGEAKLPDQEKVLDWITLSVMVRQWLLPESYAWNSPAWSISAEFFVYIIIFPIFAKTSSLLTEKQSTVIAITLGLGFLGSLLIGSGTLNATSGSGPIIRASGGFLLGVGLYHMVKTKTQTPLWDYALGLSTIILFLAFYISTQKNEMRIVTEAILLSGLALLICSAYISSGALANLLSNPALFWLGEISLSLYLCHVPVMTFLRWLANNFGIERGFSFGVACILISVLFSSKIWRHIEVPCRIHIRNALLEHKAITAKTDR